MCYKLCKINNILYWEYILCGVEWLRKFVIEKLNIVYEFLFIDIYNYIIVLWNIFKGNKLFIKWMIRI